jgi:hypothetical protein
MVISSKSFFALLSAVVVGVDRVDDAASDGLPVDCGRRSESLHD